MFPNVLRTIAAGVVFSIFLEEMMLPSGLQIITNGVTSTVSLRMTFPNAMRIIAFGVAVSIFLEETLLPSGLQIITVGVTSTVSWRGSQETSLSAQ